MGKGNAAKEAAVGVVVHSNSAVLVTVAGDGEFLDRRDIQLTEPGLPTHPHHHEGSWAVGRYLDSPGAREISLPEALALVEQVREAAQRGAMKELERLAAEVAVPIERLVVRECPELPPTTEERIRDHRAQTMADSVMYRETLMAAAEELGWSVMWYDLEHVYDDAAAALGCEDLAPVLSAMGKSVGPPWQAKHKLAAAAAITAIEL